MLSACAKSAQRDALRQANADARSNCPAEWQYSNYAQTSGMNDRERKEDRFK
jgi:hypothetical protein